MSRIGNQPIPLSAKVKVELDGRTVRVTGPKATLEHELPEVVGVTEKDGKLYVSRTNETRQARALHGLNRSLVANMVAGVEQGFSKQLEIQGVGYRAQVDGSKLVLSLGFSHPVEFPIPDGITITVTQNTRIAVEGADKQRVGQVAATIRSYKKPEPYKGKGIRYVGEYVMQKEGKTV